MHKLQSNADCSCIRNQMKSNFIMATSRCKITRLQSMDIFLLTDKFKSSSNYFYGTNQYFQRPTYANWPEAVRIRIASVALEVELVSIKRTGDAATGTSLLGQSFAGARDGGGGSDGPGLGGGGDLSAINILGHRLWVSQTLSSKYPTWRYPPPVNCYRISTLC